MPIYKDDRNVITPLFDQIRRITETEDAMTFERATESLLNIVPGGGLPTAETGVFGTDGALAFGLPNVSSFKNNYGGWRTCGLQFTPTEAFAIVGYRYYIATSFTIGSGIKLWDSNGNLLATSAVPSYNVTGQWQTIMLDTPVNVAIGAKYTVGIYTNGWTYATMGTPNAKIRDVKGCSYSGNGIPTSTTSNAMGVVDIIIGAISAELPDSYEIQRTTMDDIAVEVQRITGTESKMTVDDIQSGLESVVLQEKSVTPSTEPQTIVPDAGYYGISKVTVGAVEESGGSSMFVGSASGILPTVYKGTANSEFTLNFETSATGALSE